jgi:hypothetical protein
VQEVRQEGRRPASDAATADKRVAAAPVELRPRGDAPPPLVFHRGAHAPYATRWFGATSLAGHARNLVASAIAAESIDARDWMRPARAERLLSHVVQVLGGDATKASLAEALGRPVWVDFVADTGDDHDVSQAVARMLFTTYAIEQDGETRVLPRGDVLLFGGDTAYPVATGEEIARRLVAPWNEVLRERAIEGEGRRVLLGIAGNHDWYDGLDGFGRLFRRRPQGTVPDDQEPRSAKRGRKVKREAGIVARQLHLDELSGIARMFVAAWRGVRALVAGEKIVRPRRLALVGYDPVQDASYWALPLAPGLEAWGVDRQLGRLDYRQRLFFAERRRTAPTGRLLFVAPDPAVAFGERHEPGARMLSACRLSLERDSVCYLTGDMHHYERRVPGAASLHVIAGGGGAFLHGTRVSPSPTGPAACAYPTGAMSRHLLAQVPLKLMAGSSGFILHMVLALIASLELGASARGTTTLVATGCVVAVALAVGLRANMGHNKAHPWAVGGVAIPFGAVLGLLPMSLRLALPRIVPVVDWDLAVVVVFAFVGALVIGLFFVTITLLGLEHQQAFVVLSHPGFKHFVRMCVHPDGRIEAFAIGKDDPVGPGDAVMVDRFEWGTAPTGPALRGG